MRIAHAFGRALVVIGIASSLLGSACARKAAGRLKVAVTIFPIYDLARTVAGPDADVILLVPPGRSVNAAPGGADGIAGVKLGIMVGLGLDGWMQTLLQQGAPSAHRLVVGDRVPTIPIRQGALVVGDERENDTHAEGSPDPHVWLDPERAMLMSKAMAEEMARADPAHAAGYRSRSFALQQDLDALDHEIAGRIARWASRSFVSFPSAFAYYADHYHLDVAASVEPAAGVPAGVLDPVGGQIGTDTYDKLLRFDTDALERIVRSPADGSAPE